MNRPINIFTGRNVSFFIIFLIAVVLIFRYAEPVKDGDLWFHLAYGKYFIENQTLIPDHTVFTWSPTTNQALYCAWLPQIIIYVLYNFLGLAGLFALRYLALIFFIFVFYLIAKKQDLLLHPMSWSICLLGLLMSFSAAFIKPELFSYVFFIIMAGIWFYTKLNPDESLNNKLFYIFPILMLIWVNSHGVFVFGAVFLFFIGVGEGINQVFKLKSRLSQVMLPHLATSLVLSALTLFITPYGWRYPAYLINWFLSGDSSEWQMLKAYKSIFDANAQLLHFQDYLMAALILLMLLLFFHIRKRGLDFTLLIPNIVFGYLYTQSLRMTYYWVPIACFSMLYLLGQTYRKSELLNMEKKRYAIPVILVMVVGSLFLSGRSLYEAKCHPFKKQWMGFGISYQNPVDSAQYIKEYISETRIGNDYGIGGYLLWHLWPEKKIFIDPRQFPFSNWIAEYMAAMSDPKFDREQFLNENDAKVWCLGYNMSLMIRHLLASEDWRPVFYGASAIVFVDRSIVIPPDAPKTGDRLFKPKNMRSAQKTLAFAVAIKDWDTAFKIAEKISTSFSCCRDEKLAKGALPFVKGKQLFHSGQYKDAAVNLQYAFDNQYIIAAVSLSEVYNFLSAQAWNQGDIRMAASFINGALRTKVKSPYTIFNAGVIKWYNEVSNKNQKDQTGILHYEEEWRQHLKQFMSFYGTQTPKYLVEIVRHILENKYQGRPPLLVPPKAS